MVAKLEMGDRDLLERMERLGSATIPDLCAELSVTATAVRQRLYRLVSQGLVSRETQRHGRGRPSHAYRLTILGTRELGDNYAELAMLLWSEIQHEAPEVRDRVRLRLADTLVAKYGGDADGRARLDQLARLTQVITHEGFRIESSVEGGLPVLRESHCPYPELARKTPEICALEQEVYGRVLGMPLSLKSCMRDGAACCEFRPAVASPHLPEEAKSFVD